jgi:hypothetical protein
MCDEEDAIVYTQIKDPSVREEYRRRNSDIDIELKEKYSNSRNYGTKRGVRW